MAVISQESSRGGRLPCGPHRLTSEQVADNQRQRLVDAMLHLAGKSGYADTTVAEIIERAEVSRKTFYAHFTDRDELLLAAFDETSPAALEEVRAASMRTEGPTRRIEALMRRFCRVARESPDMIALSTIEIAAVDPDGLERRERLMGSYGALIDECLCANSKATVPSSTLARTLAGSAHRTVDTYLRTGRRNDLSALAPELARWVRSYHPVPPSLITAKATSPPRPYAGSNGLVGGRAPGTLTLAPDGYQPPRATRSSGFVAHADRERILDAVAQLIFAHGYATLTAQLIARHANLSRRTFASHFKNKDEAFVTTVEVGHIKGQAIVERVRASAPDWRTGVRNAVYALLEFLASEPYFTRLAFVDAPLAGPAMALRTHEHARDYAHLLLDGAPQHRRPARIAPEAIAYSLFELAFHHAARHKVEELSRLAPVACYLTLAPFLGVNEAAEA